jgi:hypothetical protein
MVSMVPNLINRLSNPIAHQEMSKLLTNFILLIILDLQALLSKSEVHKNNFKSCPSHRYLKHNYGPVLFCFSGTRFSEKQDFLKSCYLENRCV